MTLHSRCGLVAVLLLALSRSWAQAPVSAGQVGIGTTAPDASAVLDLTASDKGLLVPRLDSVARVGIAAPATGLLVFQTNPRQGFYYFGGPSAGWRFLADKTHGGDNLGNGVATTVLNLQGNALVGSGADIGTAVGVGVRADGGLNLGYQAGASTTGGGLNQFVGYQSGYSDTEGSGNQFTGSYSGYNTTTGSLNQFSGYRSGFSNTSGNYNLFDGFNSGRDNTTGSLNQFSGFRSGAFNTSGDSNQFSGFESGLYNETGSLNLFVGNSSGYYNRTGSRNWAFGYGAGPTTGNLTNAGAIGYQAQVSQSNALVLGGIGLYAVRVGIGTTAPDASAVLDLTASDKGLLVPRLDSVARVGTAAPATGLLVFQTNPRQGFYYFGGPSAGWRFLADKTRGGDNLGNHTATQNLNLAGKLLVGNGGSQGLAISSSGQVGIGTASPAAPLEVLAGPALTGSTTGTETQLRLTRPGTNSAKWNSSAELAVGTYAPGINSQSQLDFRLGNNFNSAADQTVLTLRGDGRVGLGTPAPRGALDVAGGNTYLVADPNSGSSQSVYLPGHLYLAPYAGSSGTAFVQARVPNPTSSTSIGLTLRTTESGTLQDALVINPNGSAAFRGAVTASGLALTSDARFKQQVRPLAGALAGALALRGVRYRWNALGVAHGGAAGAEQVGLLAQEVEKIYPELVSTDAQGYKSVNYAQLTPVLLEAIRELAAEAEAQRTRAAKAEATLGSFEQRLRALEAATTRAAR